MRKAGTGLLLTVALVILAAASGCFYDHGDMVLNETVCVTFDQEITSGSFSTFVVCDQFKAELVAELTRNGRDLEDVKSIHMVSGTYKTQAITGHDWKVTAQIYIARQDDPSASGYSDGPALFTSFDQQSLKKLRGSPKDADLESDGVELVDRALESLLDGEDPRLVLIVENDSVSPEPSESDPMEFKLKTCVKFQAILKTTREATTVPIRIAGGFYSATARVRESPGPFLFPPGRLHEPCFVLE